MRRILALVVAAATLTPASVHSQSSLPDELVWHWFGICQNAKTMGVEVRLDRKRVFASSFPPCLVRRTDYQKEPRHDNLKFVSRLPREYLMPTSRHSEHQRLRETFGTPEASTTRSCWVFRL
jgi:hypothetical protein